MHEGMKRSKRNPPVQKRVAALALIAIGLRAMHPGVYSPRQHFMMKIPVALSLALPKFGAQGLAHLLGEST